MDKPTFTELTEFNPATYIRFIEYLRKTYRIVPFCEIPTENIPYLILRHDIDISLESALKMAQIEHTIGVRSTYFVLLSSKHYNPFEGRNVEIMRQISRLGHEIGLHYDVEQYECYAVNHVHALKNEMRILESLVAKRILSISSHAPRKPGSFLDNDDCVNADNPRLMDIYVHDSQRLWTIKSLSVLLNNPPKRVQLSMHPCFWDPANKRKTKLDLALLDALLFLNRLRTLFIRVAHSRESCEN